MSGCCQFKLNGRGVTLIELTVAVALTAIITSIIYFTWNHITIHTIIQNRKTSLSSDCQRITRQFSRHLHKAETILRWDRSSIQFTTQLSSDTISYSFNGTTLLYNNNPVAVTSPQARVRNFSLDDANMNDETRPYLFNCIITLENNAGDTVSSSTTVLVHRSIAVNKSDNDFAW